MTRKLDPEKVRESIDLYRAEWDIGTMQVAIYVLCRDSTTAECSE